MKLKVKTAVTRSGSKNLCLCDERGIPLPDQMSVTIQSLPNDIAKATVVFALGDGVKVVGEDQ